MLFLRKQNKLKIIDVSIGLIFKILIKYFINYVIQSLKCIEIFFMNVFFVMKNYYITTKDCHLQVVNKIKDEN